MRTLLILSLLSLSFTAKSQCCPYIDSIEIIPTSPTISDSVKIVTTVTTPFLGQFLYSTHSLIGTTLTAEACYFSGGFASLDTHFDTLDLGTLSAGTYSIDFTAYQSSDIAHCNYSDTTTAASTFEVIELAAGLEPVSNQLGKIYPNPSSGAFTIELPDEVHVTDLIVRSISGKVVYRDSFMNEMNLNLESGTYLIEFLEGDSIFGHQRLVIQ